MKPIISSYIGRLIVTVLTILLPWPIKRTILTVLLGYNLDPSSKIGFSIVSAAKVKIGKEARIGHLTVCRDLCMLELDDYAQIGNLNWITGDGGNPLTRHKSNCLSYPSLKLGTHSSITNRHYIDCSDSLIIGSFSTIAGVKSQLLTHSIDIELNIQKACSIIIGDYCFIGTGCIILSGSLLPSYSVLAAGSLLREQMNEQWMLYAGIPAKAKKKIPKEYAYFNRTSGFVI